MTGLWYLSDHGESTGEHGLYLHGSPLCNRTEPTNTCTNDYVVL